MSPDHGRPDHGRLHEEVVRLARDLIRLDSTNAPGNETPVARHLAEYLADAGVDCELVARDPLRANLVARLPGTGDAPSLAFVGHTDVVPADTRDWTHPPFEGVVDDDGYLYGRGAVDMKNEVAARAVALAHLARSGFRPRGDLWFLAVADEEDGTADVGMRWLLESRPDIRPDQAVNEGGGLLLELADGRRVMTVGVGEKGTFPARVTALGQAGHASTPSAGDNAVPHLAELVRRVGQGMPRPRHSQLTDRMLEVLLAGDLSGDLANDVAKAGALHPFLEHMLPALVGTTMAPTVLDASSARNVLPARASVELDCRILPGDTEADVERDVRERLGSGIAYELSWPEQLVAGSCSPTDGPVLEALAGYLPEISSGVTLLPVLDSGFTDSVHLRAVGCTAAYGFNPAWHTPAEVVEDGYHNADERIHVDDLLGSTLFHVDLAHRLLGEEALET